MSRRQNFLALAALVVCVALPPVPFGVAADAPAGKPAGRVPEPKEWDHLDGRGLTKKKVDVVEWEKNLEIHVYPKGSLKSLGLKIDRKSKSTKNAVLVIEYGFKDVAYTLIRRAMLNIPLSDAFHVFRDDSIDEYDKILISNNVLSGLPKFALAPAPTQLYPDHYTGADAGPPEGEKAAEITPFEQPARTYDAKPGKTAPAPGVQSRETEGENRKSKRGRRKRGEQAPSDADADGAIRSFAF